MARKLVGTVASDVQDKTIIVAVARRVTHPLYGKQYTLTKRFAVHDEENQAHVGDRVEIVETRPISKKKAWRLSRVAETGYKAVELKEDFDTSRSAQASSTALQQKQVLSVSPTDQAKKKRATTDSAQEEA